MKEKIENKKARLLNKQGFSLVEVLVTLMVLAVGITAVSALMLGNIKNSRNSKNQIIASQLAQEGIELVRNLKDNNNAAFLTEVSANDDYRIDYQSDYAGFKSSNAADDSLKKLYLNADGFYAHAGASSTKFYRKIKILNDPVLKQITVTAVVSWNAAGFPAVCNVGSKCMEVVSILPDMQ